MIPPFNQPITAGLNTIKNLLLRHCSQGTHVPYAREWLHALVYELNGPAKNEAYAKAQATEFACGLKAGQLTNLEFTPFFPESSFLRDKLTVAFRTPVYRRLVSKSKGKRNWVWPDESDKYRVESRQYEVTVEWANIHRIISEIIGEERWGPHAKRLPGLDMMAVWTLRGKANGVFNSQTPEIFREPILPSTRYFSGRSTFWWEAADGGFRVPRFIVRDLLQKEKGKRRKRTFHRGDYIGVCFASLRHFPNRFSEQVEDAKAKMNSELDVLPKRDLLVPGYFPCFGPEEGTSWGPDSTQFKKWRVKDPESWVAVTNAHLQRIEYFLRIQAELERSYVSLGDFKDRLAGGEEPELAYVVHPGSVAAPLVAQEKPEDILKLLQWVEHTIETDTRIQTVIKETEWRIKYEEDRVAFANGLRLALAVAEITYEYATDSGSDDPESIQAEGDVQTMEIDVQDIDEQEIEALFGQGVTLPKLPDSNLSPEKAEEPGLIPSTPVLNFIGGLGVGKIGVMAIKNGGRTIGKLWLKRKARKQLAVVFEKMQAQVVQHGGKGAIVSIHTGRLSPKVGDALKALNTAFKNKEPVLASQKRLNFTELLEMGKRYVCAGATKCLAMLRKPNYQGILLKSRDNSRQFRIGEKIGAKKGKLEANFENLTGDKRWNVHYDILVQ